MRLYRLLNVLFFLTFFNLNSQETVVDTFDENEIISKVSGSYKVKAIHYIYLDTAYKVSSLDYGRFLFTNKNYALQYNPMMVQRMPFKNLSKPENEEIIKAFKSVVFNSGSYTIDDDVIHIIPDIAKVPGFENGHQYYKIGVENDTLTSLTMYDETYPDGEKPQWFGKLKIKFILEKE